MKNFKFYFNAILGTSFLSALVYGTAPQLVDQHVTICSFALLALVIFSMFGMMNCLVSAMDTNEVRVKQ